MISKPCGSACPSEDMWRREPGLKTSGSLIPPVTITACDICTQPISQGIHLAQGGPITAKDLVSSIPEFHPLPNNSFSFKSITGESITCPKGNSTSRSAVGKGVGSLQAARQAGSEGVELTKSQSLLAVNYFELKWQPSFPRRATPRAPQSSLS